MNTSDISTFDDLVNQQAVKNAVALHATMEVEFSFLADSVLATNTNNKESRFRMSSTAFMNVLRFLQEGRKNAFLEKNGFQDLVFDVSTVESYMTDDRAIVRRMTFGDHQTIEIKTLQSVINYSELGWRMTVKREQDLKQFEENRLNINIITRTRQRWSALLNNGLYRIDLTRVIYHDNNYVAYEGEVELTKFPPKPSNDMPRDPLFDYRFNLIELLRILRVVSLGGCTLALTQTKRASLLSFLPKKKYPAHESEWQVSDLIKPVDLLWEHMHPSFLSQYDVGLKSNGKRMVCYVIIKSNNNEEAALVLLAHQEMGGYYLENLQWPKEGVPKFQMLVLDVEVVVSNMNVLGAYDVQIRLLDVLQAFFVLSSGESITEDFTSLLREQRLEKMAQFASVLRTGTIDMDYEHGNFQINVKTVLPLHTLTYNNWSSQVREINQQLTTRQEEANPDGYIFTLRHAQYSGKVKNNLIVAPAPYVFKLKPRTKLTIDLLYTFQNGKHVLELLKPVPSRPNVLQEFTGSVLHPVKSYHIKNAEALIPFSHTVGEFLGTMDANRHAVFVFQQWRMDKVVPNFNRVVSDVWNQCMDPILDGNETFADLAKETALVYHDILHLQKDHVKSLLNTLTKSNVQLYVYGPSLDVIDLGVSTQKRLQLTQQNVQQVLDRSTYLPILSVFHADETVDITWLYELVKNYELKSFTLCITLKAVNPQTRALWLSLNASFQPANQLRWARHAPNNAEEYISGIFSKEALPALDHFFLPLTNHYVLKKQTKGVLEFGILTYTENTFGDILARVFGWKTIEGVDGIVSTKDLAISPRSPIEQEPLSFLFAYFLAIDPQLGEPTYRLGPGLIHYLKAMAANIRAKNGFVNFIRDYNLPACRIQDQEGTVIATYVPSVREQYKPGMVYIVRSASNQLESTFKKPTFTADVSQAYPIYPYITIGWKYSQKQTLATIDV